jgi:adenylate kinase
MAAGGYVDDETMLAVIRDRLSQPDASKGFILDGFPRTVAQADGLAKLLAELGTPLDAVVLFEVDNLELIKRLSGRRVCELCKNVFNVHTAPPSIPPNCLPGRTEHQVVQRPDDTEETVRERLRVYEEKTRKPVSGFYSYTGLIRTVDGDGDIEAVTQRLLDTLHAGSGTPTAARKSAVKKRATKRRSAAKPAARVRQIVRRKIARKPAKKASPRRRVAAKKRSASRKVARKARRAARPK